MYEVPNLLCVWRKSNQSIEGIVQRLGENPMPSLRNSDKSILQETTGSNI